MTKILSICALLALAGCDSPSNDIIIQETKKCVDAGLEAQALVDGVSYEVRKIQCLPKVRHE
jgi:uncharacterized lipoprotein YajG